MNSTSATRIITFRPYLSARMPVTGLAISAPRLVQEVMRPMSRVVSGWPRSEPMETRVDEMTPVLRILLVLAENQGRVYAYS